LTAVLCVYVMKTSAFGYVVCSVWWQSKPGFTHIDISARQNLWAWGCGWEKQVKGESNVFAFSKYEGYLSVDIIANLSSLPCLFAEQILLIVCNSYLQYR